MGSDHCPVIMFSFCSVHGGCGEPVNGDPSSLCRTAVSWSPPAMEELSPNLDQATYWTQSAGPTWVELNDDLDRQIAPLGAAAIAALAPKPGERIIDIGCGCGQTVLALAEAVGPQGRVLGVDISEPML